MELTHRFERALLQRLVALPAPALRLLLGPPQFSPDGLMLSAESQLLLRAFGIIGRPEQHQLGIALARRDMDASVPIVDYAGLRVRTKDRTVPGPRGPIPIRLYHPRKHRRHRPIFVYFHGGGFVVGSVHSHDGVCRALCHKTDAIVVSVDYRLAPEHRFPAGVEDAVAATRWVLKEARALGGDPRAVAVGGDSAGGNLAAVVTQATRSDERRPMFQALIYPATDMTRSFPSHRLFREGYMLPKPSIDWFLGNYLNDDREQTDPRASPLFAKDLSGLPPALVITAGFDALRDEGRAYADKLAEARVPVRYQCIDGAMHGFFSFGGVFRHAARAVDDVAAALREAFAAVT